MSTVHVTRSPRPDKKWVAAVPRSDGTTRDVHFGARGYDDYTTHKDPERMRRYVARHRAHENWRASGVAPRPLPRILADVGTDRYRF